MRNGISGKEDNSVDYWQMLQKQEEMERLLRTKESEVQHLHSELQRLQGNPETGGESKIEEREVDREGDRGRDRDADQKVEDADRRAPEPSMPHVCRWVIDQEPERAEEMEQIRGQDWRREEERGREEAKKMQREVANRRIKEEIEEAKKKSMEMERRREREQEREREREGKKEREREKAMLKEFAPSLAKAVARMESEGTCKSSPQNGHKKAERARNCSPAQRPLRDGVRDKNCQEASHGSVHAAEGVESGTSDTKTSHESAQGTNGNSKGVKGLSSFAGGPATDEQMTRISSQRQPNPASPSKGSSLLSALERVREKGIWLQGFIPSSPQQEHTCSDTQQHKRIATGAHSAEPEQDLHNVADAQDGRVSGDLNNMADAQEGCESGGEKTGDTSPASAARASLPRPLRRIFEKAEAARKELREDKISAWMASVSTGEAMGCWCYEPSLSCAVTALLRCPPAHFAPALHFPTFCIQHRGPKAYALAGLALLGYKGISAKDRRKEKTRGKDRIA